MDIPDQKALKRNGQQNDDQNGEEDGLVVKHGYCLGRCADGAKPVELAHIWFYAEGLVFVKSMCVTSATLQLLHWSCLYLCVQELENFDVEV